MSTLSVPRAQASPCPWWWRAVFASSTCMVSKTWALLLPTWPLTLEEVTGASAPRLIPPRPAARGHLPRVGGPAPGLRDP